MSHTNYKHWLTLPGLIATTIAVQAQAPRPLPAAYSSGIPVNYVRSWDAVKPVTDAGTLTINSDVKTARMTTQYYDGLGRPIQTVIKQGSLATDPGNPTSAAGAVDLISMTEYDEFGRVRHQYLPTPASTTALTTTISNGLFKRDPFQQQQAFYNNYLSNQSGEVSSNTNWAYSQTNYEASPLNRPLEQFAPGVSWAGTQAQSSEASRRSVKMKYWINTATDAVRIWNVTTGATGSFSSYASPGTYPAGQLYKNVTADEHGKQVIEFKDKEGKVVLKKVQLIATADDGSGSSHSGWLSTYYLYDDLSNLRCVIQPEGVNWLSANNWDFSSPSGGGQVGAEQCFRYEYDERNRMIVKKVPGAGEVYMVYDTRDRLVMTQDANLRALSPQQWLVTLYDGLNRPVQTGLLKNSYTIGGTANRSFAQHRAAASPAPAPATFTDYPFAATATPNSTYWELLSQTGYDSYSTIPGGLPGALTSTYDNSWNSQFSNTDNNNYPYPQLPAQSNAVKGMITWTQTKILGSSPAAYITAISLYDDKGRVIQVKSSNASGGADIATTQYSWAGQPLVMVYKQEKAGSPAQTTVTVTRLSYDDLGRLVKTEKKLQNTNVNSNAMSAYKTIAQNEYDALGQLKKKKLAPGYNSNAGLETLSYDYNIRGWMLGMNREYARDASSTNYFGFDLGYDKTNNSLINNQTYTAAQYNGNIAGMVWKSKGDGEKRRYDFGYDGANRLLKADFTQYTGSSFNQTAGVNYNMKMGDGADVNTAYDANGNIKKMQQWGWKLGGSTQVDNLSYTYTANTNKLLKVQDAITTDYKLGDFKDGSSGSSNDYTYDVNGNLVSDLNKAISAITYNHLNLPQVMTVTGKGTITYTYDAGGNKLRKVTQENSATVPYNGSNYTSNITTTTLYIGGAVYESKAYSHASLSSLNYTDKLQFIGMEEGRVRYKPAEGTTPASFQYDYMLKDHLGNVRMVLTEEQRQDKYPVATLEPAKLATEDDYYTIDNSKIVDKSTVSGLPAYTNDNGIGNNPSDPSFEAASSSKLYKLNSSTNKMGLGITLKVMAGDRIDIHGKSYWNTANSGGSGVNSAIPVLDLLNALLGTTTSVVTGGHTGSSLNAIPDISTPVGNYIGNSSRNNPGYTTRPKAFINYIFFDEQFKLVTSGFSAVNNTAGLKNHFSELQNLAAAKNGYVYIYVSNESPVNVFFDNLQVIHTRGAMLEETHYYPFGLAMSGISSKALNNSPANKYKYNGIEQNNDFDLNIYDAFYRNLDPQIGRFWQIDPKPNEMYSSYSGMQNNPIRYADPLGDTIIIDKVSSETEYQQNGQTVTGAQLAQQMVDEMAAAAGLTLSINSETGMVSETGVAENKGYSRSARKLVRKMLGKGGKTTINFSQDKGSGVEPVGSTIMTLGVNEIEALVRNTPNSIQSMTLGYGMTAFHEWFHTKAGGSFAHSASVGDTYQTRLDKPDIEVNKIRTELTAATGLNYGQRGSYTGVFWLSPDNSTVNSYMPLSQLTQVQWMQMIQANRKHDASLLPQIPFIYQSFPNPYK